MTVPPEPMMPRKVDGGITLIEMLIVMAIIGVATGAATLGLGALARQDAAEVEAHKLAAALADGIDEALITGLAQPVVWDSAGYRIGTEPLQVVAGGVTLTGGAMGLVLSDSMAGDHAVFVLQDDAGEWRVSVAGLAVAIDSEAAP